MRKTLLIVIGIFILVIAGVNVFLDDPSFNSKEEKAFFYYNSNQFKIAEKTYSDLLQKDSINIDLHYKHIKSHFNQPKTRKVSKYEHVDRDDNTIYSFYYEKSNSINQLQRDIGNYGLGLINSIEDHCVLALKYLLKIENARLKYLNNSLGYIYLEKENYDSAEYYFQREIEYEGNIDGSSSNLFNLYLVTNQLDKIPDLLKINYGQNYSKNQLTEYYFKTGKIGLYLYNIISIGFDSFDLKSLLAALLIVIIWLIYLRKIDLFEPEKWLHLIIIFLLGILFSYGTFILADLNNHLLGFSLNGKILNDFIYSVIGIGLIEELMKLIPFLIFLKYTKAINEPVDYVIYISASALGFAFAENMLYFSNYGLTIIHGRALVAVVLHMFCSSIIGYGLYFGLSNMNLKLRILIFLLLASFVHGFYDFWLINKTVNSFSFISFFILIFGLSVWNSFINNSLNFSIPDGSTIKNLDHLKLKDYLIYGLSSVLLLEYFLVSFKLGAKLGNESLLNAGMSGAYLLAFISSSLSKFSLKRNSKEPIRLTESNEKVFDEVLGEKLTINRLSKSKFEIYPCRIEVFERFKLNDESNWYVVNLENSLNFSNVEINLLVIKIKDKAVTIRKGKKVIIGVFFIKLNSITNFESINRENLIFNGWARIN